MERQTAIKLAKVYYNYKVNIRMQYNKEILNMSKRKRSSIQRRNHKIARTNYLRKLAEKAQEIAEDSIDKEDIEVAEDLKDLKEEIDDTINDQDDDIEEDAEENKKEALRRIRVHRLARRRKLSHNYPRDWQSRPIGERVVEQALWELEPGANKEQVQNIAQQQLPPYLYGLIDDIDYEYSDSDIDEFVDNVTEEYKLKNSRRLARARHTSRRKLSQRRFASDQDINNIVKDVEANPSNIEGDHPTDDVSDTTDLDPKAVTEPETYDVETQPTTTSEDHPLDDVSDDVDLPKKTSTLLALKLAEAEIDEGIIDEDEKYDAIAEHEDEDKDVVEAKLATILKIRSARSSRRVNHSRRSIRFANRDSRATESDIEFFNV
jgi:hypothetical protein